MLAKDLRYLGDTEPGFHFKQFQWLARRDTAMLPPVPDENHPGIELLRHFKHAEHVAGTKLAGLIDEDHTTPGGLLHVLILQESRHCVGHREARLLA